MIGRCSLIRDCQLTPFAVILAVRLTQSLSNHSLRKWFAFFNAHLLIQASLIRNFALKKPVTYVTGFVATIELHSNQIWNDLRGFYSLVRVFEKLLNPKKVGY